MLFQVNLLIIRNFTETPLELNPLLFKYRANGYDLGKFSELELPDKLELVKKDVNYWRVNFGTNLIVLMNPQIYNFNESREERTVMSIRYSGLFKQIGCLKKVLTINPGILLEKFKNEQLEEEELQRIDAIE